MIAFSGSVERDDLVEGEWYTALVPPIERVIEAQTRVIYGDTDQMGVVYYANYFRFFELSRNEFFRAVGGSYVELERAGFGLPVIDAQAQYKAPAKYDDLISIEVRLTKLGRASLQFEYRVVRKADGQLLATGSTMHACVGPGGKPTGLPREVVRLLSASEPP